MNKKQFTINSNWTAYPAIKGWRHYRVSGHKHKENLHWYEMMSVCDRKVRFWVTAHQLGDQDKWLPGWH